MVGSVACGAAVHLSKSTGDGSAELSARVPLQQPQSSAAAHVLVIIRAVQEQSVEPELGIMDDLQKKKKNLRESNLFVFS